MRLLIESNEEGKRAQERAGVLQAKVRVLDSANRLYAQQAKSKDSTISDQQGQVFTLYQALANQGKIADNNQRIAGIWEQAFVKEQRTARKQRRGKVFWRTCTIVAGAAAGYFGIKSAL